MNRCVLAIDIGASSGRHIVGWIENGKIHTQEVYRFPNGMKNSNGHLCWDIDSVEQLIKDGLRTAFRQGYSPISIAIDTWGVDYVLLNQAGEVVGDVVAYRDQRTDKMDELLEQSLPYEEHYHLSGVAKQSYSVSRYANLLLVMFITFTISCQRQVMWTANSYEITDLLGGE